MQENRNSEKDMEIPLGLGMALAQNPGAMERFTSLSEEQRRRVIAHTGQIRSRREMHDYVASYFNSKE